jgi:flagellar basal body-associated protein FliL
MRANQTIHLKSYFLILLFYILAISFVLNSSTYGYRERSPEDNPEFQKAAEKLQRFIDHEQAVQNEKLKVLSSQQDKESSMVWKFLEGVFWLSIMSVVCFAINKSAGIVMSGLIIFTIFILICVKISELFINFSKNDWISLIVFLIVVLVVILIYLLIQERLNAKQEEERERKYKASMVSHGNLKSNFKNIQKQISQQEVNHPIVRCPFCDFEVKVTGKRGARLLKKEAVWLQCEKCKIEFSLEVLP